MKKPGFLAKLKQQGRLELVEQSENICNSYVDKANGCLGSAKLLLDNGFYENSVSMSYYAMYNSLTALLSKAGIKCENHSGSIILLDKLFGERELHKSISYAKKERIDNQYYVVSGRDHTMTEESARHMFETAEDFLVKPKLMINGLSLQAIKEKRKGFETVTGGMA